MNLQNYVIGQNEINPNNFWIYNCKKLGEPSLASIDYEENHWVIRDKYKNVIFSADTQLIGIQIMISYVYGLVND